MNSRQPKKVPPKEPKAKLPKQPKNESVIHKVTINHNAASLPQALGLTVDDLNGSRANVINDCIGLKKSEALELIIKQMNKNKDIFVLAAVNLLLSTFK